MITDVRVTSWYHFEMTSEDFVLFRKLTQSKKHTHSFILGRIRKLSPRQHQRS